MSDSALSSLSFQRQPGFAQAPETALRNMRFTQEALKGTPETVVSNQVTARRGTSDVITVGKMVAGSVSFEMSYLAFRHWIEAALTSLVEPINITATLSFDHSTNKVSASTNVFEFVIPGCSVKIGGANVATNNKGIKRVVAKGGSTGDFWIQLAADSLGSTQANVTLATVTGSQVKNGRTLHYYELERSLRGADGSDYFHKFSSCVVDGLELTLESQKIVTGSLSIVGVASSESNETASVGGAVLPAETDGVIGSNMHVGKLLADGVTMAEKMKSLKITLKNGCTANDCIGQLGAFEISLGDLSVEFDANFYFADNNNIAALNAGTARSLYVELGNEAGTICLHLPRFKFSDGNAPVAGKTGSVMQPMKGIALDSEAYDGTIFVTFIPA